MRHAVIQAFSAIGNASANGSPFDLRFIYRLSGQVVTGAGAATAGSMKLQVSNDPLSQVNVAPGGVITGITNWTDFGTAATVSGAGVLPLLFSTIPWTDLGFAWGRMVYTDSSGGAGAGLITVNLSVQGF